MPSPDLQPGLSFHQSIYIDESMTAAAVLTGIPDLPPVLATAFMVVLVESTCIKALRPYLLQGEDTVGTLIDVSHIAATPIGFSVTVEVRLLAVVGRKLRFRVTCHDEYEPIGEGCHERAVVDAAKFAAKAAHKGRAHRSVTPKSPH